MLAVLEHVNGAIAQGSWASLDPCFGRLSRSQALHGLIEFDSDRAEPLRDDRSPMAAGDVPPPPSYLVESPWTTQIRHFADVIEGTAAPIVTARDAVEAVRIADVAARSIASGEPMNISSEDA